MRTKLFSLTALFFLLCSSLAFGQSVTLDHVDGLLEPGKITTGEQVSFYLKLHTTELHTGITNGFRIYSDDGATWGSTVQDTLPVGLGIPTFDVFQFFPVNTDGVGADTVGFGGVAVFFGTGIPADFDKVAYKITVGPIDPSMHGKHLTLDSSFYPNTGTWKWAPSTVPSWDGPHTYTITDPNASSNTPPVLATVGNKSTDENVLLTFNVSASDAESTPALSATGLPTGATFDDNGDGTGTFSWTPTYNQGNVTPYSVTFIASDGEFTDEETIQITVNDVNRAPVLTAIGNKSTDENVQLSFIISATDPDGDAMEITSTPLPTGASLTPMGNGGAQFSWTPTYDQGSVTPYDVTFTVSDGDLTDDEAIQITVNNVNRLPQIVSLTNNSPVNEGDTAIIIVEVSDPDGDDLNVSVEPAPANGISSIEGNVHTYKWPTGFNDAGSHQFTVTVSDGTDQVSDNTTVEVLNVNQAPVLNEIGPKAVTAGGLLEFNVVAIDPDGTIPALSAENVPAAASFTDNGDGTGTFSWKTDIADDLSVDVNFIASDGELTDEELVTITVGEAPKYLTTSTDSLLFSCYAGVTFKDSAYALIDEQNEFAIAFTASETEDWLTVAAVKDGITPDSLKFIVDNTGLAIGTYSAEVTVSSADAVNDLTIRVYLVVNEKPNTPPVLAQLQDVYEITECDELSIPIGASDADEDMLVLGVYPLADNMAFTDNQDNSGLFTFAPNFSQADTYMMTAFAFDGKDTTKADFSIIVADCEPGTEGDTVRVATVPAVPGAQIVVPVDFANICTLYGFAVSIGWNTDSLVLDSVSFVDSRVTLWESATIDNENNTVMILGTWSEVERQEPGSGNMANLHFSVACGTPAGFYPLTYSAEPSYEKDCGGGTEFVRPFFIDGGVTVDVSGNYVCGYVVDTEGNPVPGATVELWNDYPGGMPEMSTMASGTGVFAFSDFNTIPFDLYAYADGYLPGSVEKINFAQSGIMIVLTKTRDYSSDSPYWVTFRCTENSSTYLGAPLPVGTVVEAFVRETSDNVKCGEFVVSEAGVFGPMYVYGEDNTTNPTPGARTGDVISFYVNGIKAIPSASAIWDEQFDPVDLCLEVPNETSHTCMLHEGWNLVSWNVDTESDDILDVLASIDDCLEIVMGFEQGALIFEKDLPMFSDLWSVDHMSGYWIKVSCDVELNVVGTPVPANTPIPLTAGWNLVSYLPDSEMATADALAGLSENLIIAMGYDNGYTAYIPGDDLYNDLTTMAPCFGYWVKTFNAADLAYPDGIMTASSKKDNSLAAKSSSSFSAPTNRWVNLYAYDLTLNGKSIEAGSEINAYSKDGLLVGSYTMKQNGQFGFMPVYGDDLSSDKVDGIKAGEEFYLTVNGVETEERFTWTATGEKIQLNGLSAKGTDNLPSTYGLNQNYPNPFNPATNISFTLPVAGKATVEVYNMLGEKVATIFNGQAQAGLNSIEWDGRNESGNSVASGIYFYRLTADKYTETKKMTLIK